MVVLMILIAFAASADSWLSIDMSFDLGYVLQGALDFQQCYAASSNQFEGGFSIEALLFSHIVMGGQIETLFDKQLDGALFDPTGAMYTVYAGLRLNNNLQALIEHRCDHPVVSQVGLTSNLTAGGYTRVYIEFKTHTDF